MDLFNDKNINLDALKKKAYNYRWAEVAEGVIPLTAADLDFPVAPEIVESIVDYVKDGYFSYTPKRGLEEMCVSIANGLKKRRNQDIDPNLVLPIDSAARGMSIIANAFLSEGDEAIVFDPVDYLFETSMKSAGAKIIYYPMKIVDGAIDFSDLEDYITPKTKMLSLCNPHNPLGKLYSLETLEHILKLANKYDFYIMNDEIWSDIIYSDETFNSILHLGNDLNKKTLTVSGYSKGFGIAGLRAGYVIAQDQEIFDEIIKTSEVDSTIGGISSLSQIASIACMDQCFYWVDEYIKHLEGNRDYALERLEKMPGITCEKPQATYVLFPNITATGMGSVELTEMLKEKYKLAIVPGGKDFFGYGSEGHVRIVLATGREMLAEGLDRLEKALNDIANG